MAAADHEIVLTWLNDAYTIENALIHVLELHAKEAKKHPEIQAKLDEHLAQTHRHAELVAGRITALGGASEHQDVARHEDRLSNFLGPVQNLLADVASAEDERVLKSTVSDYAAENFEIATYGAILTAAEDTGDADTARVCRQILGQEQEMAQWLDEQLPSLVEGMIREARPA